MLNLKVKRWTNHLSRITPERGDTHDRFFPIVNDSEERSIGGGLRVNDVENFRRLAWTWLECEWSDPS